MDRIDQFFPSFYGPSTKRAGHENKEGKNEDPYLAIQTEQTGLTRCLLYDFVDYSRKRTKSFDVLTSDQKLEVRGSTYGPEIDQSQRAKSVGHIIKILTNGYLYQFVS